MSLGFVNSGRGNPFTWLGDKVLGAVQQRVQAKLYDTGKQVVATAQTLAPVDTGALRASIGFIVTGNTLTVYVDQPYGIFQEFGTRNIPPHPYIRPALNAVGRIWGGNMAMQFAGTAGPGGTAWHGLKAGKTHYAASHSKHWKPLTQKQITHVETRLTPGLQQHNRGNVRRAKMVVRHSF